MAENLPKTGKPELRIANEPLNIGLPFKQRLTSVRWGPRYAGGPVVWGRALPETRGRVPGTILGCSAHLVSGSAACWVPEGSLAGMFWVGFWGLGGPWGL